MVEPLTTSMPFAITLGNHERVNTQILFIIIYTCSKWHFVLICTVFKATGVVLIHTIQVSLTIKLYLIL